MTPTIDAVIFDCDGTLIDSETVGFGAILKEAKKQGVALMGHAIAVTAEFVDPGTGDCSAATVRRIRAQAEAP